MSPKHLEDLLCTNNREGITSNLCSCNLVVLMVPYVDNKTFAACSFSVQGPIWWNRLPASLQNLKALETFKTSLMTDLFNAYYNS